MSHKYDLTISTPESLVIELPAPGDEENVVLIEFVFHKKLTRQQRLMMFIQVGEGSEKRQLPDLPYLWRNTIKKIVGLPALKLDHVQCEEEVTEGKFIAAILNHPDTPEELVNPVTEYIIDQNVQGEDEGNG